MKKGDFASIKESLYKVVSDVSGTLGEINVVSEEVGKNAENAKVANDMAQVVGEEFRSRNEDMQQVVDAMAQESSQAVKNLQYKLLDYKN